MHTLDRGLQLGDRLVEVVVHDGQVEEVPVRLLQHVRLFRQSFQTAVKLESTSDILEKSLSIHLLWIPRYGCVKMDGRHGRYESDNKLG